MDNTSIIKTLQELLELRIPQQFLKLSAFDYFINICRAFDLPPPNMKGGNIVIGNLSDADIVLSAHLDEASFNVASINDEGAILAPCHRYIKSNNTTSVDLIGIRESVMEFLGTCDIHQDTEGRLFCASQGIQLGDRAIYASGYTKKDDILTGRALDDRTGGAIALHALSLLKQKGIKAALVLSDEEQNLPDGYFSRTFPHVLGDLKSNCHIFFIDGIFLSSKPADTSLLDKALIVPHSGQGKGYTVPPLLFAKLRDQIIPLAQKSKIDVDVCDLYHSRGDDWGMVTNPTSGHQFPALFISFLGWGETPTKRNICIRSLESCVNMIVFTAENLVDKE